MQEEEKEEQIEKKIEEIRARLKKKFAVARQRARDQVRGKVEQTLQVMDATAINPAVVQKFSTSPQSKVFKCGKCKQGWAKLDSRTGHVCPVLDTFKALCYVWYAVKIIGKDESGEDILELMPVKFGFGECGLESLRFLSLPADYKANSDLEEKGDQEYVRKVKKALDEFAQLHLTLVEFGGLHDREDLSADQSLARVQHAEAVCIKTCDRRDLLTNTKQQTANIQDKWPEYESYKKLIIAKHQARNRLSFDREQFNQLVQLLVQVLGFRIDLEAIKAGKRGAGYATTFLTKTKWAMQKQHFEQTVAYLRKVQEKNGTKFEHIPTIDWLYQYNKRKLKNRAAKK